MAAYLKIKPGVTARPRSSTAPRALVHGKTLLLSSAPLCCLVAADLLLVHFYFFVPLARLGTISRSMFRELSSLWKTEISCPVTTIFDGLRPTGFSCFPCHLPYRLHRSFRLFSKQICDTCRWPSGPLHHEAGPRALADHHPVAFFTGAFPNLSSAPQMANHLHLVFREERYW